MKSRFGLLLVVALLIFVVGAAAGCGETTTTTAPGDTTTTVEATTTTAAPIGTVVVMGVWGGGELESFQAVAAGWEQETGGTMEFEGTRDLTAILRARVSGNNPPDMAILPNPALMVEFAKAGVLQPIDEMLDMAQLAADYGEAWIDQGSVDGALYGLFIKAATKSTVWYSPAQFEQNGWAVPTTWDEMIALSDEIVVAGNAPWSVGVESGGASGWPGTDWIQEILLAESGPDIYDQWVAHEIPWTDAAVKSAFEKFGEIVLTEGYVPGGAQAALATNFEDASYLPFDTPPQAYMYFLGAFTQGFITAQFPDLVAEEDYDFFSFPTINPAHAGAVTGGGDIIIVFNDSPSVHSLLNYLAQADPWESWAAAGGYASPNKSLPLSVYPDPISAKAAEQLTESAIFRFDADDLMPGEVQAAFFKAILDYLQNPANLDTYLADVEAVATTAYGQ
jgi:alpha-glucoside transport system substrate-binding protein